jgi:hypothetical protein
MAELIQGAEELKRALKGIGPNILGEIAPEIRSYAEGLGSASLASVPVDSGNLAASFFTDGAQVHKETVTATTGYASKHAAYEHEGFHFGRKVAAPPKWLEKTADDFEGAFAEFVGDAIRDALPRVAGK